MHKIRTRYDCCVQRDFHVLLLSAPGPEISETLARSLNAQLTVPSSAAIPSLLCLFAFLLFLVFALLLLPPFGEARGIKEENRTRRKRGLVRKDKVYTSRWFLDRLHGELASIISHKLVSRLKPSNFLSKGKEAKQKYDTPHGTIKSRFERYNLKKNMQAITKIFKKSLRN